MTVIIAAVFLAVIQLLGFVGLALSVRLYLDHKQAQIEDRAVRALHEWVDPSEDGGPSQMGKVAGALGDVMGRSAAQSIMASLAADRSHVARLANGLADEVQSNQNPLLGLLTGGRRGKGAALARLAELLGPSLLSGGNGSNGRGGESSEYRGRRHRE